MPTRTKTQMWQAHAAGTTVAYRKEVVSVVPLVEVAKTITTEETVQATSILFTNPSSSLT